MRARLLDARTALQLLFLNRPDALHLDGGWQTLVDGLARTARKAGAQLMTTARVTAVETEAASHMLHLADGRVLEAKAVLLALEPARAAQLVRGSSRRFLAALAEQTIPLYAACLDVALARLPDPQRSSVLHLERPLFYSNHSRNARLAPEGRALLHIIKYLRPGEKSEAEEDRAEMEAWLDQLQPGWREQVVAQQFLPHMLVSSDMLQAQRNGLAGRPGPVVPSVKHLYIAGDWVGTAGQLANASLTSGKLAAEMMLTQII